MITSTSCGEISIKNSFPVLSLHGQVAQSSNGALEPVQIGWAKMIYSNGFWRLSLSHISRISSFSYLHLLGMLGETTCIHVNMQYLNLAEPVAAAEVVYLAWEDSEQ